MATAVLSQIDLNGKIVTADALHTVKATAEYIHERGGPFVLPVKENWRALFDVLPHPRMEGRPPHTPQRRQRSRPGHHPDHSGPACPTGSAVPAR
jgi:hypothetical protein